MSTLIVLLPPQAPTATVSPDYVLADAAGTVLAQGSSPLALLPAPSGPGASVVAVASALALSWHDADLPKGGGAASGRFRPVLEGLLEDRLLDDVEDLHFALSPGARGGALVQVAVCRRDWLRGWLAALEGAGRTVQRIVPQFSPGRATVGVLGSADEPDCVITSPRHVMCLPLSAAVQSVRAEPLLADAAWTEPAVAEAAERALARVVPIRTRAQQLVEAAASEWDLAQFDLAQGGGQRTARRLGEALSRFFLASAWRPARWAVLSLLAINLIGLQALAWRERSALDAKQKNIQGVLQQSFPSVKLVIDPPLQMAREVAALRQATGALSSSDLENMLSRVSPLVPGARIDGLEYRRSELRLRGTGLDPLGDAPTALRLQSLGLQARAEGGEWVLRVLGETR